MSLSFLEYLQYENQSTTSKVDTRFN